MSKLDRVLVSTSWVDLFPNWLQFALPLLPSDHCPISLVTILEDWGPPPFQLELMWPKEKSFLVSNLEWWNEISASGWMGFQLFYELKILKKSINQC